MHEIEVGQIRREPMREGSGVNKKGGFWWSWHYCFEIGDKKMASEESKTKVEVIMIPAGELPDDIPRDEFAERVLQVVKDNLLGKIMKSAVNDSTDNLLKKEMTKLADEVIKFRQAMSKRMLSDESLTDKGPVCLERLSDSFEAGWKEWKSGWGDREELAYQAFIETMTSPPSEE